MLFSLAWPVADENSLEIVLFMYGLLSGPLEENFGQLAYTFE